MIQTLVHPTYEDLGSLQAKNAEKEGSEIIINQRFHSSSFFFFFFFFFINSLNA